MTTHLMSSNLKWLNPTCSKLDQFTSTPAPTSSSTPEGMLPPPRTMAGHPWKDPCLAPHFGGNYKGRRRHFGRNTTNTCQIITQPLMEAPRLPNNNHHPWRRHKAAEQPPAPFRHHFTLVVPIWPPSLHIL
ncbi:hypothetical protein V6N12_045511 [Hibiscus sabdariffa]|uniref:Uncharacterized protein n=1 Tax=Hibiscus sabdariffa TaxID=183260 RepID=A0ABR2G2Y6_9ROSI